MLGGKPFKVKFINTFIGGFYIDGIDPNTGGLAIHVFFRLFDFGSSNRVRYTAGLDRNSDPLKRSKAVLQELAEKGFPVERVSAEVQNELALINHMLTVEGPHSVSAYHYRLTDVALFDKHAVVKSIMVNQMIDGLSILAKDFSAIEQPQSIQAEFCKPCELLLYPHRKYSVPMIVTKTGFDLNGQS